MKLNQHSRRRFIINTTTIMGGSLLFRKLSQGTVSLLTKKEHRYKIAVVDLMILKRQKLGAFQLAKDIGADGVEVDMGGLGSRETFDNQLANPEIRQQFLDKVKE